MAQNHNIGRTIYSRDGLFRIQRIATDNTQTILPWRLNDAGETTVTWVHSLQTSWGLSWRPAFRITNERVSIMDREEEEDTQVVQLFRITNSENKSTSLQVCLPSSNLVVS
mmetsp:Transcript_25110/g.53101  ORF Transcript_25110/g.53101 Transcript_25110/m.53101 type:complete len:111 (-) Transcript_25110:764-1096(-)